MIKRLTTLLLCLFVGQILLAQPKVETKIDSTNVLIGDQISMEVSVKYDPKIRVLIPKGFKLGEKIEVLNERDSTVRISANEMKTSKNMLITSFDSGVYVIPPVPIQIEENGIIDTIFSRALQLTVVSPAIDTTEDFAPIKEIIEEPISFKEDILPIMLGILAALLLAIVIFTLFKYKKQQETPEKIVQKTPKLPAHIIAFSKLKQLEEKKLWQNSDFKTYHSEVSYIIRDYLENRFNIPALESVTDEILTSLKHLEIERKQILNIGNILQTADLVKFAKLLPTEEQHRKAMEWSLEFIRETKLEETEEAA